MTATRSEIDATNRPREASASGDAPLTITRVDSAHAKSAAPVTLLELADPDDGDFVAAAAAGKNEAVATAQLDQQANELASLLRDRQRELDRRETQLHALAAKIDSERRATRIWFAEQQQALAEQEVELNERCRSAEEQAAAVALGQTAVEADRDSLQRRDDELTAREREVERSEQALAAAERRLEDRRCVHQKEAEAWREQVHGEAVQEDARRARRDELESLLESQLRDAARRQELLGLEYARREIDFAEQCRRLADEATGRSAELTRRQEALDRRQAALDFREESLAKVQADVEAAHRRALESRLIVEQVWSRLQGAAAPAELSLAIAQAREQMADQYQFAEEGLSHKKGLLEQLVARVKSQLEELRSKRRRWRAYESRRQQEFEQAAAALQEKERVLAEQAERFSAEELAWLNEREQLVTQLRQLLAA